MFFFCGGEMDEGDEEDGESKLNEPREFDNSMDQERMEDQQEKKHSFDRR